MSHFIDVNNVIFDLDKVQSFDVERISHKEFGEDVQDGFQVDVVFENGKWEPIELLPTNQRALDFIRDFLNWSGTPYQVYDYDDVEK